jgi:hypothetical protein
MNYSLPILAWLAVAGAAICPLVHAQVPVATGSAAATTAPATPGASASAATDSSSGDSLVRYVLAAVDAQPSVSARLRFRVDLMGRTSEGTGIYLQQGRGAERQLRLDLNLQTAALTSRLRQVCDGSALWILQELADERTLARVDVARLRRARPKSPAAAPDPAGWLALGGLPKLLVSLDEAFCFGPVSESRLDDLRVWTVVGLWEPARLVQLLPDQKEAMESGKPVDYARLSPQLPSSVVLHVGHDDFFPYRLEYWRARPGEADDAAGGRGRLLAVMELFEVRVGGPIDAAQFAVQPPTDLTPSDRTPELLERLGLEEAAPSGARRGSLPRR